MTVLEDEIQEAKKTKKFYFSISFLCKLFLLIIATGIVLVGQYQAVDTILTRHKVFLNKHRRDVIDDDIEKIDVRRNIGVKKVVHEDENEKRSKTGKITSRHQELKIARHDYAKKREVKDDVKKHNITDNVKKRVVTDDLKKHDVNDDVKEPRLTFVNTYNTRGVLELPYGGIREPFEAWYSKPNRMSRIDYYGGMDCTFQREDIGEFGFAAKVVPEYSEQEKRVYKGCLHHVGNKRFPIRAQNMVPSPKLFKFEGACKLKNVSCWKWQHQFTILTKVNTYTLYTTRTSPTRPLRYEMMGYDTLLTSYYDKYVLEYTHFEEWKFDFEVFEIPSDLHCFEFESLAARETTVSSFNPMFEFLSHAAEHTGEKPTHHTGEKPIEHTGEKNSHLKTVGRSNYELVIETIFREFKNSFNKLYSDNIEHVKRKDIFRHNMRFINARNRQHLPYKLHVNHFADVSDKEMHLYKGLLNETYTDHRAQQFRPPKIDLNITPIPNALDWREYGAVTDVRSQGICGSCYAYAVTGAMEGALYLKTGDLIDLSEQQIIDCSWGFGNRGCKGGYPYRAMQWIMKHGGVATQTSYGNYLAQEGYCHFENVTKGASISSYYNITRGNVTQLKMALALYGPLTVLINTRPRSFKFYNSGVYFDGECDRKLDHAALLIGYGREKNEDYWLIKNSWSPQWGHQGFIKIAIKNDNCGVTQRAVGVQVETNA